MTYRAPGWRTLLVTAVVASIASALLALSRPVVMLVDGERVESDVQPIAASHDRVYVPLRSIADALGADTSVDDKGQRVVVVRGGQTLELRVGDTHARLDGMPMTLRHAPFRVRGRVMISLKAIADAFDVRATYDPRTARIDVLTPGIGRTVEPPGANLEQTQ
ncbi:MAG TPA: copper amine oxidase N-terminal domain-containing protein [Candidatus Acidoferrales bacterium]|nr:copper amine oxidase N-terminal domain-containing protein [Candidatus Acidoferrales bacterium]